MNHIIPEKKYKVVLSIAGLDPSGGAGILADIKTFSALSTYGMAALTACTAQNTQGVQSVHAIPTQHFEDELYAIFNDIEVDAVKIGMLHSPKIVEIVARFLKNYKCKNIVLDPVMISKSGHHLLREDAIAAMKTELIPISTVLTPNIPEAEELLDRKITTTSEMEVAARDLAHMGAQAVLVKGGHCVDDETSTDVLYYAGLTYFLSKPRVDTKNTHGSGCTFSAAVAALLAHGHNVPSAVREAKEYIHQAILSGADYMLGHGAGPVNHFFKFW